MNFKHYNGKKLVAWITILFIIESLILARISPILDRLDKPWKQIIDITALFGSLSLVYLILELYDKYFWKYLPSWLNLVSVPDVNGAYEGELISSFKDSQGNPVVRKCHMQIHQTASDIFVEMEFFNENMKTTSRSRSEQIENYRGQYFILQFVHLNDGNYDDKDLNMHKGLTTLKYYPATKEFKGDYFNDPHRKTYGKLNVKKKEG